MARLVDGYISNLSSGAGSFDGATSSNIEAPTSLLWAKFLKSHLLEKSGRMVEALALIEECILHTPTALDMHIKKAKILRKLGDPQSAADALKFCCSLDLQDRYLNNKTTKYLLRADQVTDAINYIEKFVKGTENAQQTILDLQCCWYQLEMADSYKRQKKYSMALKKYFAINSHFSLYYEDQIDFHGYCLRKHTLRAYLDSLNMNDQIFSHKFYQRAAQGVLSIYLMIFDQKDAGVSMNGEGEEGPDLSHLSPAERKKEKARLRKIKKKAEEAEQAASARAGGGGDGSSDKAIKDIDGYPVPKDEDPKGEKLLALDPLEESNNWCLKIQRLAGCEADTHALIADVMLRRNKLISCLRSIVAGLKKSPTHAKLTFVLVKLAKYVQEGKYVSPDMPTPSLPIISEVVKTEVTELLGGTLDVERFALEFAEKSRFLTVTHRVVAVKSLLHIDSKSLDAFSSSLLLDDEAMWTSIGGVNINSAMEAYMVLVNDLKLAATDPKVEKMKSKILEIFPYHSLGGIKYESPNLESLISPPGAQEPLV